MNSGCSADSGRWRRRRRRGEARMQLDEEPSDDDDEGERLRGGAEYRCLRRPLATRWRRL
jgi:hypothetical protein